MTEGGRAPRWSLVLYVNGSAPRSMQSVASVRTVCDSQLAGTVDLEVVDVRVQPDVAARHGVIAVPTLVRYVPAPVRRISGDFSDLAWLRGELGLRPSPAPGPDRARGS